MDNGPGRLDTTTLPSSSQSQSGGGKGRDSLWPWVQRAIRYRWPAIALTTAGVMGLTALALARQKVLYEGYFRLLMEDSQSGAALLQSEPVAKPLLTSLQKRYPTLPNPLPLTLAPVGDTQILAVRYRDTDQERLQGVLNTLADGYRAYGLRQRQANIDQGLRFIEKELPGLQKTLAQRQGQLQAFQRQSGLLDPYQQAQGLGSQRAALQAQSQALEVGYRELSSLNQALQAQLQLTPAEAIAVNQLLESPAYQRLYGQLQQVEGALARKPQGAEREALLQERQQLVPQLRQAAQSLLGSTANRLASLPTPGGLQWGLTQQYIQTTNQLVILQAQRQALAEQSRRIQTQLQALPNLAQQYVTLQRAVHQAGDRLDEFLAHQTRLQIERAQQISPWTLLTPPTVLADPLGPRPALWLSLAGGLGVLFGLGAAIAWERSHPIFHNVRDVQQGVALPIWGIIPWQKDLQRVETLVGVNLPPLLDERPDQPHRPRPAKGRTPNASFLEAFRALHTQLILQERDYPLKSFLVTSTHPGDGKSLVAVHLAQAAAAMGKRVLLVDANGRSPHLHDQLSLPNEGGLGDWLTTGKGLIQRVPQWQNLSLVTAGPADPQTELLLTSPRMESLMADWERDPTFDWIIYDSPALTQGESAQALARSTQGVIYVVRPGKTHRRRLEHHLAQLEWKFPLVGLVINGETDTRPLIAYDSRLPVHG